MQAYLTSKKKKGQTIKLTWIPCDGLIYSDLAQKVAGETGFHVGIVYLVYCSIHPNGLSEAEWIADFNMDARNIKLPPSYVSF